MHENVGPRLDRWWRACLGSNRLSDQNPSTTKRKRTEQKTKEMKIEFQIMSHYTKNK